MKLQVMLGLFILVEYHQTMMNLEKYRTLYYSFMVHLTISH